MSMVKGLRFWKLLGSGKGNGFSLRPDFSRYALLAVWASEAEANHFFNDSSMGQAFREQAFEQWTIWLAPIRSHGQWDGANPFQDDANLISLAHNESLGGDRSHAPIAVLTRARIRSKKLLAFWRRVPSTSHALGKSKGLIKSIGVGELPFIRQATFSLWQSQDEMMQYAYHSPSHRDVVRRTRQEDWYGEDLFTRFVPLKAEGTWNGQNPMNNLTAPSHHSSTFNFSAE